MELNKRIIREILNNSNNYKELIKNDLFNIRREKDYLAPINEVFKILHEGYGLELKDSEYQLVIDLVNELIEEMTEAALSVFQNNPYEENNDLLKYIEKNLNKLLNNKMRFVEEKNGVNIFRVKCSDLLILIQVFEYNHIRIHIVSKYESIGSVFMDSFNFTFIDIDYDKVVRKFKECDLRIKSERG